MQQPASSACEREDDPCGSPGLVTEFGTLERLRVESSKDAERGCDSGAEVSTEGGSACSEAASSDVPGSSPERQKDTHRDEVTMDDAPVEGDLAAQEEDLTKRVPKLLDSMNRASKEVNALERQVNAAQGKYSSSVAECNRVYEELRAKNGRSFDRVKPYFFAVEEVKAASHRMQNIAYEFAAKSTRYSKAEEEGRPCDEVQQLLQERDQCEEQYVSALREHRSAQEAIEALRGQFGDAIVQSMSPAFQQLQECQLQVTVEQSRMNTLVERAQHSKLEYQRCMRELEHISMAVHNARREHGSRSATA